MSSQQPDPQPPPEIPQEGTAPAAEIILPTAISSDTFSESHAVPAPAEPQPFMEPRRVSTITPDLNVPWSWGDLVVFLLFYFGCTTIFSIVVVFGAAAVMHIGINSLINTRKVLFVSLSIVAQALASLSSIFYLRILAYVRGAATPRQPGEGPWQLLGWRSLGNPPSRGAAVFKYVAGGIGLAFAVSIVSEFVGQRRKVPFEDLFQSRQTVLMLMAFGILLAPVVEEMMFRGFLYPVVARRFGIAAGIMTTGILFGAFHAMQLWGAWEQIALLGLVGIVLTWVRARSHTIVASYIIHVAYNSTLFAGVFLATHGLSKFPAGN